MTRAALRRKAHDATHLRLLLSVRHSRGAARVSALRALKAYVTEKLREEVR